MAKPNPDNRNKTTEEKAEQLSQQRKDEVAGYLRDLGNRLKQQS